MTDPLLDLAGDTLIDDTRAFNRFYTGVIGVLDEHLADSPFGLAEARVLYEIATRGHTTGSELSRALGLDRAYLTRILQGFAGRGLTAVSPNPSDRRGNSVALTRDGDEAFFTLRDGAEAAVARMLAPLSTSDRRRLADAMWTIRTLLGDEIAPSPVVLRPPRIGEIALIASRQAVLYAEEYGWDGSYEGLAAEIAGKFAQAHDPAREACWVAEWRGDLAGSIFVVDAGNGVAQLRLLYVESRARSLGIGRSLVEQVINFARAKGYRKIRLWTQSELTAARRLSAAAGFKLVESKPHHSFGVDLVGEYWELPL
ncbi:MAG: bifunctional helix-turn-helix transcriptional regulator/GNAT family N-acetyltransferase [Devosia sp.]